MKRTRLVASTTMTERDFWTRSLLGRSLLAFPASLRPRLQIRFENRGEHGLPAIYNRAIETCPEDEHLLLVHDDVWIHDVYLQHRLAEGLERYDVVGLAGSKSSDPGQPSWCLAVDEQLRYAGWQTPCDPSNPLPQDRASDASPSKICLSGAVSHVSRYVEPGSQHFTPAPVLTIFGPFPAECDLLDGLFLAAKPAVLRAREVRFDERFSFHLYDLDFCRTARGRGLRLGTWPLLASHGSTGNFDSEEFRAAARLYLDKWAAAPPARAP